jgi:predicted nucleic acid-binding protein
MICDTTFLSDIHHEREERRAGPATAFAVRHRRERMVVTVISVGELTPIFASEAEARNYFQRYRILRLTPEIAYVAAQIDRELIATGSRLGENDNWIAGFCRYYGQPIVSRDGAFDRVRGLRRMSY